MAIKHRNSRAAAIQWAKSLVQQPFVVLDLETTGYRPCEPVQIAIINHNGVELLNTLVKPMTYPISEGAAKIHGITTEMVNQKDVLTFAELWDNGLWQLLNSSHIIIYNVGFDRPVLEHTIRLYELAELDCSTWDCAMVNYAAFHGEWNNYHGSYKWQKLELAAKRLGVQVDGDAHDALVDVQMTLGVIQKMARADDG